MLRTSFFMCEKCVNLNTEFLRKNEGNGLRNRMRKKKFLRNA